MRPLKISWIISRKIQGIPFPDEVTEMIEPSKKDPLFHNLNPVDIVSDSEDDDII